MKLLSHNHLLCLNRQCKSNEALRIEPIKVIQIESEPKMDFIIHILQMIDYKILYEASKLIGIQDLPSSLPDKQLIQNNESFLRCMQKVLLETHIIEGRLHCTKCQYSYLISNGVVDMMHPQKKTVTATTTTTTTATTLTQSQAQPSEENDQTPVTGTRIGVDDDDTITDALFNTMALSPSKAAAETNTAADDAMDDGDDDDDAQQQQKQQSKHDHNHNESSTVSDINAMDGHSQKIKKNANAAEDNGDAIIDVD